MPPVPEPATGLLAAALLAIAAGTLPALGGGRLRLPRTLAWLPAAIGSALLCAAALQVLGSNRALVLALPLRLAGLAPALALDPLAAWLALAIAITALASALSAAGGLGRARTGPAAAAAFHLILLGQVLFLLASDLPALLLGWQMIALGGWAAIAAGSSDPESAAPAGHFLLRMEIGAALAAAGLLLAGSPAGVAELELGAIASAAATLSPGLRALAGVLILAGLLPLAGVAPFHTPLAYGATAAAPAEGALLLAGLPRLGWLGIARLLFAWLPGGPAWWGTLLSFAAAITLLYGLLLALAQRDLRRVVALGAVASAAPSLIALGAAASADAAGASGLTAYALGVALFAGLAHAAVTTALALSAGALGEATGLVSLDALGGLLRRLPWSAHAFLIAAVAAAGLPPFSGFVTTWLVTQVLLLALHLSLGALKLGTLVAILAVALGAALAPVAALRAAGAALLGRWRGEAVRELPWAVRLPALAMALACGALGLFAAPLVRELTLAVAPVAHHAGTVPALTVPSAGSIVAWPAAPIDAPGLSVLRMPALVAAVTLASFLGLALLRFRRLAPSPVPAATSPRGPLPEPGAERLTASGLAQPFVAALPELYGAVEEATILEGKSAHFPTRVELHHGIEPWLGAQAGRLGAASSDAALAAATRLGSAALRARLAWLLVVALLLLMVLGR